MSDVSVMDNLDPTREMVVEAIGTLEDAIESVMPAQAPRSTSTDITAEVRELRLIALKIAEHADQVESALNGTKYVGR
ncbi:MAG: hypothetical protein VXW22_12450 [Pseudomonadota bacterium]|nr:hypothetical protein [Pseudomonadota bacterium]